MPLVYPDDYEYQENDDYGDDYDDYSEEEWAAYYESMLDPDENDN